MSRYKENGGYTRLGSIYHNMKTRCYNPNYDKYQYYGGKGITICDDWLNSYDIFEEWALRHGYKDGLTLDRIDNNGNYTPDNCRWVSMKEQANNRSTNHSLTYNDETKTIQQWSEETGLSRECIEQRIYAGWSVDKALTEPNHETHKHRTITYNGQTKRLYEWAKELGISYKVLHNRLNLHNWPVDKAFCTPVTRWWSYGN